MVIPITAQQNRWPWLMLPARLALFAFWQIAVAIVLLFLGVADAWQVSAAWWPVTAVLANLVCIGLLHTLYRREGARYWDIFRIQRQTLKKDLLILLGALILTGPIAFVPNILSANWLFGTQQAALDLFIQPLPLWGIVLAGVLFPMTIALAELPIYFAYVMPRLEVQTGRRWLAVLLPSLFLAAQHCTLPLIWNGRFLLWRFFMFLPFALFLGLLLRWRPQLLPYLVVVHGLMDLATVLMIPMAV
ncbi:MAG: hypothetical protein CL608_21510 [Anaerolineaceae bacterium]|nr:hypothetical protein [Anaerolineaceae bacterium]